MLQNISVSNKCCSSKIPENVSWFPQKYEAAQLFLTLIDFFFSSKLAVQHVCTVYLFLKCSLTLKTGVMVLKVHLCITGIGLNYILKHRTIAVILNGNNISQ